MMTQTISRLSAMPNTVTTPFLRSLTRHSMEPEAEQTRNIVLRLWDWSEWCRQVVRGVQSYSHGKKSWRLFVDVGQSHRPQVFSENARIDGILTHVLGDTRAWKRLITSGKTKVVSFATTVPKPLQDLPRVRVDDAKVASVICRHLVSGGLRHIAFCGSGNIRISLDSRQSEVESLAAMNACKFSAFVDSRKKEGPLPIKMLATWINSLEKPVGVVAWNIEIARRIVQACQHLGTSVPASVCVVAWDDDPMLAETLEPTISAAVLPAERLGYEAASLLDRLLLREVVGDQPIVIQPSGVLRIRQSSDTWALKDREVYLALQYIREHAAGTLKVPQIARHVGISRKKLELDFARVLSQTPYNAIVEQRLELAKKYLLETNWDTARVAKMSGVGDASTLRRWFLQRFQLSVNEFRKRNGFEEHR